MKIKIQKNTINILFLFFAFFLLSSCDQNNGKSLLKNNNITVKVFSSLTCPHCANFHENVVLKIKNDKEINNVIKFHDSTKMTQGYGASIRTHYVGREIQRRVLA